MTDSALPSPPDQQLATIRERLVQQGGVVPTDAELGLALLQAKGLDEVLAPFPQREQQALGLLLIRLAENPSLLAAFTQASTPEVVVELARHEGISLTPAMVTALQEAPQELDDADLAQVAGGVAVIATITTGLGIAATVVGALAVANKVEAFLYSNSSAFLGEGIRNTGKTILDYVP